MMLAPTGQRHPLYGTWGGMIARCHHAWNEAFYQYGACGIRVCDRWRHGEGGLHGFECFVLDMGPRPEGRTLDRIDNAGNYEPGNCRWATLSEQSLNQGGKADPIGSAQACRAVALAFPDLDAHSEEFREKVRGVEERFRQEYREIINQIRM